MLKIKDLKKEYESFSLNISLEVKKGSITGIVGQNGAGKSTAFKSILGLIRADGGSIEIFGKDISSITGADKALIGVVLSDSGFSGYLTVKDIIPVLSSLYDRFDKARFIEQTKRFGLPLNKQIKEFSTGMKAKLKTIVALSHGVRLLVLDEPTSGLDIVARDELILMLREFMEEDEERAILISSHISSDLESLCDDIYMIHGGMIILHEDTDVLIDNYGIIKLDEASYEGFDKSYITALKKETYGYCLLTSEKQFYIDNYPEAVIEKGSIDTVISMMIKGDKL